eukprot:scaffold4052_cov132-Skeletonema_menzelii.AAC.1
MIEYLMLFNIDLFFVGHRDVINAAEYCLRAHERYQEWGAIGKCTSLFEFFGSVMNGCVASSPTNANNVQP